ncbi:hypothetical protein GCM10008908_07880 [Clostridium subterminale]|uniref:O-antigen ligase-related domain-containing protein n=1 Tax=Clostridium subterminale TaxID=1550 RepID=A0ABP3VSF6_CLOSU
MEKIQNFILNKNCFVIGALLSSLITIIPFFARLITFNKLFIVWGMVIIIKDLLSKKIIFKNKLRFILIIFCLFYGITVILNYENNFISQVSHFGYILCTIFILYSYDLSIEKMKYIKNIYTFNKIFNLYSCIFTTISLILIITGTKLSYKNSMGVDRFIGIGINNRAAGMYGNPIDFGFICMFTIFLCTINLIILKKFNKRSIFYIVNIVLHIICLPLTGSRGSLLGTALFIILMCFFTFFKKIDNMSKNERKKILFITIPIVSIFMVIGLVAIINKYTNIENTADITNIEKPYSDVMEEKNEAFLGDRGNFQGNPLSGRLGTWRSGLKAIAKKPVFGYGLINTLEHAKNIEGSEVEYYNLSGGMHNIFLEFLIGSGLIGLICFLIFIVSYIVLIIKVPIRKYKEQYKLISGIISIIISMLATNIFDSSIIFPLYLPSVIFWTYLGFGMYIREKSIGEV